MTQNNAILKRLKRGGVLTALDALKDPSIRSLRLSARIDELKGAGHKIETTFVKRGDKVVAAYKLKK